MASSRVAQILSGVVAGSTDSAGLPQRLALACAASLSVTGVGLVLMTDEGPAGVVAATDGPAATMEELQYTLGEGPCVDSSRTGRPVLLPDLARTGPGRWPAFSAGALEAGICAIFAFPLRVGAIRLGVLDLYRDRPGLLSVDELAEALSFSDAATALLMHLQYQSAADGLAVPLVEDRAEVHQATGFIAFEAGVSLSQALVLLRARAYASNRATVEVAKDVLAGVVRFSSDEEDLPGQ